MLGDDGILYPWRGRDHALWNEAQGLSYDAKYWRTSSSGNDTCSDETIKSKLSTGQGCISRLIENNWVMDY